MHPDSNRPAPRPAAPLLVLPNWIKAATRCGFNIQPLFEQQGLRIEGQLENLWIEPGQLAAIMEACVAASRGPHFPFVLGETFAFEYQPDIETFLATSPSLRDAFRVFEWVQQLINPLVRASLGERQGEAALILQSEAPPPHRRHMIEAMFASTFKFTHRLLDDRLGFRRLRLDYPTPAHAPEYEAFFGIPVQFDQADNALEFDAAMLDAPLPGGFPLVHEQARVRVEQRVRELRRQQGLAHELEAAFRRQPALLAQPLAQCAAAMGLHARTLQRRLQDEGLQFSEVRERARHAIAAAWLADPRQNLETIAERLGFSDRRSFTRAFTRWSGQSPSMYRKSLTQSMH